MPAIWLGLCALGSTCSEKHCCTRGRKKEDLSGLRLPPLRSEILCLTVLSKSLAPGVSEEGYCPLETVQKREMLSLPTCRRCKAEFSPCPLLARHKFYLELFRSTLWMAINFLPLLGVKKPHFEWALCFARSYLSAVGHRCIAHIMAMPWHLFCVCNPTPSCFSLELQAAI